MYELQIATALDPRFKLNYICELKLDVVKVGILLFLNLSLQNKLIELVFDELCKKQDVITSSKLTLDETPPKSKTATDSFEQFIICKAEKKFLSPDLPEAEIFRDAEKVMIILFYFIFL